MKQNADVDDDGEERMKSKQDAHQNVPASVDNCTRQIKLDPIVIDELLETEVGPNGFWQWSLVFIAVFTTTGAATFPVFADSVPLRRCYMGERWEMAFVQHNFTFEQIGLVTGGWAHGENMESLTAGCQRFTGDWDNLTIPVLTNPNQLLTAIVPGLSNRTVPCSNGYVYAYMPFQYDGGVVETYHMVCEQSWYIPIGTSIFMLGMMFGYLVCGFWGARFGLKHALITFSLTELVSSALSSASHAFWLYTILRFFVSVGSHGKLSSFNIILLEMTTPKYRSVMNTLYLLGFNCVSRGLITWFAYMLRNWRWLNLAATIQCVFSLAYFWLIPESPRWLLAQDRPVDALDLLKRGRKINQRFRSKREESERLNRLWEQYTQAKLLTDSATDNTEGSTEQATVKRKPNDVVAIIGKMFSSKKRTKNTLLSMLLFFLFSSIFIGLMLYMRMVRQPVYVVSLILAAAALPGAAIASTAYRIMKHRRLPLLVVFIAVGIVLCAGGVYTYLVQPEGDLPLSITLVLSVMLMATAQRFGTSAGTGRLGSAMSAYINQLDYTVAHGTPIIFYAGIAILGMITTCCLDDTTGKEEVASEDSPQADGQVSYL
ncbi:unnamed protein product [Echinostoma caproni]|uniref:MFS domain-containing protein n=1 Tax=Echinostoma caproni TaxID=27848 RepID=A0A183AQK1_9TREM|nr:unnamed protein product [Echinostoma caproni]